MTANVKLIVEEKPNVLKVPNAALRFRPPGWEGRAKDRAGDRRKMERTAQRGDSGATGRVWAPGADGELHTVALTLGVTDGSVTEVRAGDLKEGQEVVVGVASRSGGKKVSSSEHSPRFQR
jgi:HlyD family secretion protein